MAVERGEIYLVNLNPVKGREQAGRLSSEAMKRVEDAVRYSLGL